VRLLLHKNRLVGRLQHVPDTSVTIIKSLGVHAVDLAHPLRKSRALRLDQEVVVIGHLAPGPNTPVETSAGPVEIIDKRLTILVIQKDIGLSASTCHDVVKRAFEFDS